MSFSKYITVASVAAISIISSYAFNITGNVKDSSGEPLEGASLRLLAPRDSALVSGVVAKKEGVFNFTNINNGNYILETSFIGYDTQYKNVTVKNGALNVGSITLSEGALTLREAVVVGIKTPMKVMEDTIEFNADSYKTRPNAVVEDLLKRLPGVEVSSDGKITANGKEVTKILVDGKEFFSDDPKVASKNLPVNIVEKLQVVDRKSDLARLTGVDDGEEETVINLTVKKGMQNGWFGNAEAGYGTDSRYKGSFNVNRFWNGNQITLLGAINNINDPGFTDGGSRFRRFGGDNGVTVSRVLGLNFNVGNDEKFRVGGDIMYSNTDRDTRTRQNRQYLFTDSTSYLDTRKVSKDKGHNVRADFRIEWKPDSFNTFDIRPSMSYNYNKSISADSSTTTAGDLARSLVNRSINNATSSGNSWEFGLRAIYNHSFRSRPGRSFSISADINTSNVREKEDSRSWNKFFQLNDSIDLYDQYADNHTWSTSLSSRVTWTEPLGNAKNGNFLTFAYSFSYRWNNADKLTYDRPVSWPDGWDGEPVIGTSLDLNDELSNRFRNEYMRQDIRVGYKHVSRASNLEAGLSFVPQRSTSVDLINSARNISNNTFNYAPYLRYRYRMGKNRSVTLNYNGRSSQPSMTQLQPVADMSDPLKVVVGNPDLVAAFSHNIRLRFQNFNPDKQQSIMGMANATITQNSIVSKTTFNQETGGQTTTYENVNGVWNAMAGTIFSTPLRNRSFVFNASAMARYQKSVGFNNGNRNNSNTFNINLMPGLAWRPDYLEFEIRPRYSFQTTGNSLQQAANRDVHTYGGMFNGSWYAPFGLVLSTDLDYTATSGYSDGYDTKTWMWNASIAYKFLNESATITLSAYDLLGQKQNVMRNVTANYIDDTEYNSLTRYFMVSFAYKFNTFGKGQQPEDRNAMRYGGPDGPPPGGHPRGVPGGPGGGPGGPGGRPF
jgi:hypothetical protein